MTPTSTFEEEVEVSKKIAKALNFAQLKHMNQTRKGSALPYIVHPMEVWTILRNNYCSVNAQIAGILHDTVEDTDTTIEEIREEFGEEIEALVRSESEDKTKTWYERKQATIDHLKEAPLEVKQITCADKLSNCRSMLYDYKKIGDALWNRFKKGAVEQSWYYKNIVKALCELEDYPMYKELKSVVEEFYGKDE